MAMNSRRKTTLIRGGALVLDTEVQHGDLLVEGEKIAGLGRLDSSRADTLIDAAGLIVLPGGVDTHVHFNDEFMGTVSVHDYESGTRAAAYGGVTAVVDFSNQGARDPLIETVARKKEEAGGRALIDWGVHPVITRPGPETYAEIPEVVDAGAPTIKCYLTYKSEGIMVEPEDLKVILRSLHRCGGMLMVHAEDNDALERNIPRLIESGMTTPIYHARSRPPEVETAAVRRSIETVRETRGRLFIVHLASAEGLDLVASAQEEGLDVYAETCTHYLIFTEDMLERIA